MDCGVAASQRPAAGPLLPKQGHSIKHSRRAVEPTGQQHCVNSLVSRTSYGSRCSKLTAPALPVPSSTASSERVDLADLVESEVLAVLQGEPGTTTNALLASLARSSRIPKLTQAELAQVLDNLSSTGLVFKDNRGNVRLSKAARGSLPWHSPETFQAAGSLTANQSASNGSDQADVNGHATTAEQLQQDIIHILEGAPGMTSSSLHAQLTRVTRGPRLSDDEFDSLVEALSTAGLLMRDNRGNVRLAAGIVSRSPSPSPSTFHTEQRASPATSAYQLQQPTGDPETNKAAHLLSSVQREQQVMELLQGVAGTTFNLLLAQLKKSSRDPKWSYQELSALLDDMSAAGTVVRDARGNVKLARAATRSPSPSPSAPPLDLPELPSSHWEPAAAWQPQLAGWQPQSSHSAEEEVAQRVEERLEVSLEEEIVGTLQGVPGMTFSALLTQLSKSQWDPKLSASGLSRVLDDMAAMGLLFKDTRGNVRLARPDTHLPPAAAAAAAAAAAGPLASGLLQPALPASSAVDEAGPAASDQQASWEEYSSGSDVEVDSSPEPEPHGMQQPLHVGSGGLAQPGEGDDHEQPTAGRDSPGFLDGGSDGEGDGEGEGEGSESLGGEGGSVELAAVGQVASSSSSSYDLATAFPEAFFDIKGVARQALQLLELNHCLGLEQVHALLESSTDQPPLALWQVDAALCRLLDAGQVTCVNDLYSLATVAPPSPPPEQHVIPQAQPEQQQPQQQTAQTSHEAQHLPWAPPLDSSAGEVEQEGHSAAEQLTQDDSTGHGGGERDGALEAHDTVDWDAALAAPQPPSLAVEAVEAEEGVGLAMHMGLGMAADEHMATAELPSGVHEDMQTAALLDAMVTPVQPISLGEVEQLPGLGEGTAAGAEAAAEDDHDATGTEAAHALGDWEGEELRQEMQLESLAQAAGLDLATLTDPEPPAEPEVVSVAAKDQQTEPDAEPEPAPQAVAYIVPFLAAPDRESSPPVPAAAAVAAQVPSSVPHAGKDRDRRGSSATEAAEVVTSSLTRRERNSLVGKRTHALRRLRKEFEAGGMGAAAFAAKAAAIEAEYAALLGVSARSVSSSPSPAPSRRSRSPNTSSSRASVEKGSPPPLAAALPPPPPRSPRSAATRGVSSRSPSLTSTPVLLDVPTSTGAFRPASPGVQLGSEPQQPGVGSSRPSSRSPTPRQLGVGGLGARSGLRPIQRGLTPGAPPPVTPPSRPPASTAERAAAAAGASPALTAPPPAGLTPLPRRMSTGGALPPPSPGLPPGPRGGGAAGAGGLSALSISARLQTLSAGGGAARSSSSTDGEAGLRSEGGRSVRPPSPTIGRVRGGRQADSSHPDHPPLASELPGRAAEGSGRAAAGLQPLEAEADPRGGVGLGSGILAARSPSPTASLMAGLAGMSADLLRPDAVDPRDMKRKLLLLQGQMVEVQAVVRGLEARQHLYDNRPQAEKDKFFQQLTKARGVLAQVQATLQSCGEVMPDLLSREPTPTPATGPSVARPASQPRAASSLTGPRPPPSPPAATPGGRPPSPTVLRPTPTPAPSAAPAQPPPTSPATAQRTRQPAPLPASNTNTSSQPGHQPVAASALLPHAYPSPGGGQLQPGQRQHSPAAGAGGQGGRQGPGLSSGLSAGAGAGHMGGRAGSIAGLLQDTLDHDTMADLEGLLLMEYQQEQVQSELQAVYAMQPAAQDGSVQVPAQPQPTATHDLMHNLDQEQWELEQEQAAQLAAQLAQGPPPTPAWGMAEWVQERQGGGVPGVAAALPSLPTPYSQPSLAAVQYGEEQFRAGVGLSQAAGTGQVQAGEAVRAQGPGPRGTEVEAQRVVADIQVCHCFTGPAEVVKLVGPGRFFGNNRAKLGSVMEKEGGGVWLLRKVLPPGTYSVKAVVYNKISKQFRDDPQPEALQFEVPPGPGLLSLSFSWGAWDPALVFTPGSNPASLPFTTPAASAPHALPPAPAAQDTLHSAAGAQLGTSISDVLQPDLVLEPHHQGYGYTAEELGASPPPSPELAYSEQPALAWEPATQHSYTHHEAVDGAGPAGGSDGRSSDPRTQGRAQQGGPVLQHPLPEVEVNMLQQPSTAMQGLGVSTAAAGSQAAAAQTRHDRQEVVAQGNSEAGLHEPELAKAASTAQPDPNLQPTTDMLADTPTRAKSTAVDVESLDAVAADAEAEEEAARGAASAAAAARHFEALRLKRAAAAERENARALEAAEQARAREVAKAQAREAEQARTREAARARVARVAAEREAVEKILLATEHAEALQQQQQQQQQQEQQHQAESQQQQQQEASQQVSSQNAQQQPQPQAHGQEGLTSVDEDDDSSNPPDALTQWRQQHAQRMLAELKDLSHELAAGVITRWQFDTLSAQLREQWEADVLNPPLALLTAGTSPSGAPSPSGATSSTSSAAAATTAATSSASGSQQQHSAGSQAPEGHHLHALTSGYAATDVSGPHGSREDERPAYSPFADWDDANAEDYLAQGLIRRYESSPAPDPYLSGSSDGSGWEQYPADGGGVGEGDTFISTPDGGYWAQSASDSSSSSTGLRGGGSLLEPPVSPLGFPVPPEILAIRAGFIFQLSVLKAAVQAAGLLDMVPPGSLDGGWEPYPGAQGSDPARSSGAEPGRDDGWVEAAGQAEQQGGAGEGEWERGRVSDWGAGQEEEVDELGRSPPRDREVSPSPDYSPSPEPPSFRQASSSSSAAAAAAPPSAAGSDSGYSFPSSSTATQPEPNSIPALWQQLVLPSPNQVYDTQATPTSVWAKLAPQPGQAGTLPGQALSKVLYQLPTRGSPQPSRGAEARSSITGAWGRLATPASHLSSTSTPPPSSGHSNHTSAYSYSALDRIKPRKGSPERSRGPALAPHQLQQAWSRPEPEDAQAAALEVLALSQRPPSPSGRRSKSHGAGMPGQVPVEGEVPWEARREVMAAERRTRLVQALTQQRQSGQGTPSPSRGAAQEAAQEGPDRSRLSSSSSSSSGSGATTISGRSPSTGQQRQGTPQPRREAAAPASGYSRDTQQSPSGSWRAEGQQRDTARRQEQRQEQRRDEQQQQWRDEQQQQQQQQQWREEQHQQQQQQWREEAQHHSDQMQARERAQASVLDAAEAKLAAMAAEVAAVVSQAQAERAQLAQQRAVLDAQIERAAQAEQRAAAEAQALVAQAQQEQRAVWEAQREAQQLLAERQAAQNAMLAQQAAMLAELQEREDRLVETQAREAALRAAQQEMQLRLQEQELVLKKMSLQELQDKELALRRAALESQVAAELALKQAALERELAGKEALVAQQMRAAQAAEAAAREAALREAAAARAAEAAEVASVEGLALARGREERQARNAALREREEAVQAQEAWVREAQRNEQARREASAQAQASGRPPSPGLSLSGVLSGLTRRSPTPGQAPLLGQRSPSPSRAPTEEAVAAVWAGAGMEARRGSRSASPSAVYAKPLVKDEQTQQAGSNITPWPSLGGGSSSNGASSSNGTGSSSYASASSNGRYGSPERQPSSNGVYNGTYADEVNRNGTSSSSGRGGSAERSPSPSTSFSQQRSPSWGSPSPADVQAGQVVAQLSMPYSLPPNQVLRFVGGRPEFGSWDPAAAPPFTCDGQDMWQSSVALWPGYYQFKAVLLDTESGEAVWEPGPMRALTVPEESGGGLLILNCTWCDFEMEALFLWDPVTSGDASEGGNVLYRQTRVISCEATMEIEGME